MSRHPEAIRQQIKALRRQGYAYSEIQAAVDIPISKGTLSYMCKDVTLSPAGAVRLRQHTLEQLAISRQKAVSANRNLLTAKIQ